MSKKSAPASGSAAKPVAYKIVTVTELDQMVFDQLVADQAAKPGDEPGSYVVTDKEKAQSGIVMPKILNRLGRKGWVLEAVNKLECFIFRQENPPQAVEYRVLTPVDLDRAAIVRLEKAGALSLHHFEGKAPAMQVVDAKAAKIQNVLPSILEEIAQDGWQLRAVSGPQLYYFTRPL